MKPIRSIPAAVCANCFEDNPPPEGLCAECVKVLKLEFDTDAESRPLRGRIYFGTKLPDRYPGAA